MEDALLVLGDGARCRVPVRGAVTATVGHLETQRIKKGEVSAEYAWTESSDDFNK